MAVLHGVFGTVPTGITGTTIGAVPTGTVVGAVPATVFRTAVILTLSHNNLLSDMLSFIITGKKDIIQDELKSVD